MFNEDVLDFIKIKEELADHCGSTIAKEMALALAPMTDRKQIQEALDETSEALRSWQTEIEQPLGGTRDIRESCKKSRKDFVLTREAIWDVYITIGAYKRMTKFFRTKYMEYPLLSLWMQDMPNMDRVEQRLKRVFDDKGELLDTASPKLASLRNTISKTRDRIKHDIQSILHDKDNHKYFQEAIITQRNNRYVIPVKQEYRQYFNGLIHDRSATGQTLYIEPMRLVELNNDLQEALIGEEQEVLRIYKELSALIKQHSNDLMDACEKVSHIEFVYGKAKLAIAQKAVQATLSEGRDVLLMRARHPLIPANTVVPTDIRLGTDYRILLITGSNTGGKTVSLKTLGLLSIMNQSGLFIPADHGSILPIFHNIFADIGDEQSIEASLSTFSAHMTQVISIIKHCGPNDLVLLDELGSGTDPEEGSALAVSILEFFRQKGTLMMVSTHYNELKNYAYHTASIENGHVEFDERTLKPTYRLHIGVAGSSHALSIAARLGLPKDIVNRARDYKSKFGSSEMETVLSDLNEQLRKSSERERALKKELDETRRMRGQLEKEKKQFNEKRKQILAKAQADAEAMKRSLRVEGESIIKQLKSQFSETNKDKRQSAINEARKGISNVHVPDAPVDDERNTLTIDAVATGQVVYVTSLRSLGTVLSIKGNRVTVDINGLSATVKVSELQSITREESNKIQRDNLKPQPKTRKRAGGSAVQRQKEVRTEINILGQTVDEAVVSVGRFIDQAILGGINQVRIIHGKGTGALREGVHQYLRTLPQVAHFETAGYDEGGAGATNVVLK
ncbi:endonuclease MutS2 [Veillonella tobetsuensis]|uniref:Endonuclease MutS2 n=1 Tax=Veillonella tobetsuensis TaxID=1110546 RepID=A0A2S7ZNU9_9FIRM|nr:endonuclease MutS2 [Veillonella tobetsuensis]PQL24973.1 endonuclease MutS2 [Veillonella tobetsuensis]